MKHTEIADLNARTGAAQAYRALDAIIVPTTIGLAVVGLVIFLGQLVGPDTIVLPEFFASYSIGFPSILGATLVLFLNSAYNQYHAAYTRAAIATPLGSAIDLVVKVGLLAGAVVVVAVPSAVVALTLVLYVVDVLRLYELRRSVPTDNPIHDPLRRYWIPNNWRHTRRLVLLLATQLAVAAGVLYPFAHWAVPSVPLVEGQARADAAEANLMVFTAWFVVYWIVRLVDKSIVTHHSIFSQRNLKVLDDALDTYFDHH